MNIRGTFVNELHNTSIISLLIENQLLVEEKKQKHFTFLFYMSLSKTKKHGD